VSNGTAASAASNEAAIRVTFRARRKVRVARNAHVEAALAAADAAIAEITATKAATHASQARPSSSRRLGTPARWQWPSSCRTCLRHPLKSIARDEHDDNAPKDELNHPPQYSRRNTTPVCTPIYSVTSGFEGSVRRQTQSGVAGDRRSGNYV
jgi:hypothetical protein